MEQNNTVDYSDLFIKAAPHTLEDVFGQDIIVKAYKKYQKENDFPKSQLFTGMFGSGKTVLAKIVAKSIACKHKDADGQPCGTCPSCLAIDNETYDRDTIYLNAAVDKTQVVREQVESFMLTPALRDAAKVMIVDEAQELEKEGVQALLSATQNPKKGVFFIFTSMDKLKGSKSGALESRCKVWRMQTPSPEQVYLYLAKIAKEQNFLKSVKAPKEFWTKGLEFIADTSQASFRMAVQMLDQCIKGEIFTIEEIKKTFAVISYEDAVSILADLSHGRLSNNVFDCVIGNDYQDKMGLLLSVIGDAKVYKTFGKITNEEGEKWKEKRPAEIAAGAYFAQLCDLFKKLSGRPYLQKGEWKILISEFCDNFSTPGINPQEIKPVVRRRVTS